MAMDENIMTYWYQDYEAKTISLTKDADEAHGEIELTEDQTDLYYALHNAYWSMQRILEGLKRGKDG